MYNLIYQFEVYQSRCIVFLTVKTLYLVHPKNTSFDFTVELPQPINMDEKSKIALSEINYSEENV